MQDTKVNETPDTLETCLSAEAVLFFHADTADMTYMQKEKMKLLLRLAHAKGRLEGFANGLDKGLDIANGSPKVRAQYPLDEVAARTTDNAEDGFTADARNGFTLVSSAGDGVMMAEKAAA